MAKDSRFEARELTVSQARRLLLAESDRASKAQDIDRLGESLFEDITLFEVSEITGQPMDAFDDMTPSELRAVADDCIKANPFFFGMRERQRKQIADLMERNPDLIRSLMNPSD